jgi:DNA-binding FrmR family transcriptional regulator
LAIVFCPDAAKESVMSHTLRDKKKLLNRVRRIQGQMAAIERGLDEERDWATLLQQITSCRGAMNGLMAQIVEGHVELHVMDAEHASDDQRNAAAELMGVIKTYLK